MSCKSCLTNFVDEAASTEKVQEQKSILPALNWCQPLQPIRRQYHIIRLTKVSEKTSSICCVGKWVTEDLTSGNEDVFRKMQNLNLFGEVVSINTELMVQCFCKTEVYFRFRAVSKANFRKQSFQYVILEPFACNLGLYVGIV